VGTSTATKRTLSPALSWPSCQRSASITVTGQTKPRGLGRPARGSPAYRR
jgi:hypothetical protein